MEVEIINSMNTEYEIVPCPSTNPKFWAVRNKHSKSLVVNKRGDNPEESLVNQMAMVGKVRKFNRLTLAQEYINNA